MGILKKICISEKKGTPKKSINESELIINFGLKNDAHAGNWHRQISILSYEVIEDFKKKGIDIPDGAFGENLIIEGINTDSIKIGDRLKVADSILEITQLGKECHDRCIIYNTVGDCIMPKKGIFAVVLEGSLIEEGNSVELI